MNRAGRAQAGAGHAAVRSSGDRPWPEAAVATLGELTATVRKRAAHVQDEVGEDAVHDLRTATRRLRTAIKIYGDDGDATHRKAVDKELRRVARRSVAGRQRGSQR